jgi:RNase H-fold protein (predicted Holliday junction resolvase)
MILAVDPGKDKCGIAVLDLSGNVLERKIVPKESLPSSLPLYSAKHGITTVVVGQSSFGKELEKDLLKLEIRANVIFVSEKYSTLEARRRYWKENKPRGLLKIIPTSLRMPPVPVDDYAAIILGERYLKG